MRLHTLAVTAVCAVHALLGSTMTFSSGHLFWANQLNNFNLYDVTQGGNLASASIVANGLRDQGGQIAFAPDLSAAYITTMADKKVLKITPGSTQATVFASTSSKLTGPGFTLANGFSPLGILVTPDNRIFVSGSSSRIFEITSGFPVLYAWGLSGARNMLWTPEGILVAEQYRGEVTNIGTTGGDKSSFAPMATGITQVKDLEYFRGRVYAAGENGVFDITAGGAMTTATRLADGQNFVGIAATRDRIYAVNDAASGRVFDITKGGTFPDTMAWGWNLPGPGDTMFDAVPYLPQPPEPPADVPEAPTLSLLVGGILMLVPRLRQKI